jgi:hypothetical protein
MLAPLLAETAPAADRSPADVGPSDAGSDKAVRIRSAELSVLPAVACSMAVEFNFTPELRLIDGRIIRNLDDATLFAREHEARPGIDRRDEVLHAIERARNGEEAHAAAHLFLRWLEELELVE